MQITDAACDRNWVLCSQVSLPKGEGTSDFCTKLLYGAFPRLIKERCGGTFKEPRSPEGMDQQKKPELLAF